MADYNVKGEMTLATGSFIASAKAASNSLNSLNTSAMKTSSGVDFLGGAMKKLAVGALATFIVKLGRDSVKAAQTAGAAQNRLRMLLLATGGATEDQIKILNQQAAALEQMTVVSKDNVTVVQSQLATFDLGSKAIATMTPAILDYVVAEKGAAASADEYRSMTNGLALALNGQFGALTRVGFVLDEKTKADIKSGTEMERAAAIVRVLNSTYKDFSKTAGDTAAGASQKLSIQIGNLKQSFGDILLPIIQQIQGFMATKLIPVITGLMEKFKDGTAIKKFISFLGGLVKNLYDFGSAIVSVVGPILVNILVPAFIAVGAAVVGVIKVLGAIGAFIKRNISFFQVLAQVLVVGAVAYGAFRVQTMLLTAATKVHTFITKLQAAAVKKATAAQKLFNLTMAFNPIGLVVAAVTALIGVFVIAWNRSESFRKMMIQVGKAGVMGFGYLIKIVGVLFKGLVQVQTGPLRLLLKGLSLLGVDAAGKALKNIDNMTKGIGTFFDNAGNKVQDYADKLDSLENKKIGLPKFKLPTGGGSGITMPDISGLDPGNLESATNGKKGKVAKGLQKEFKDIIQGYNDFIENDFKKGFTDGSEKARDTILKSLNEVKKVFDFMGKNLSGAAAKKLKNGYDALSQTLRNFIPVAEANAQALEDVTKKLEAAQSALEDALAARAEGAKAFAEMLRTPFGEASSLTKALSSASADVDSIIGMYDSIVEAINKRYQGIDPAAARRLTDFITTQTTELVRLAKKREFAVKALEDAQNHLDDVLARQADFAKSTTDSMNSYAKALINVSDADSAAVISVTKTATGYVISQLKSSGGAIDSITNQLKERLSTITGFANNIKALLAKGLNKEYIQQLLSAGPEAAGQTALALTSASDDQLAQINSLYDSINTASTTFGTDMATVFYGNSVAMAQSFVAGAAAEVESINAQMTAIKDSITAILAPLRDEGFNVGTDLALGMVQGLEGQRASLVATAQSIADQMVAVIAAAFASINAMAGGMSGGGGGGGGVTKPPKSTKDPTTSGGLNPIQKGGYLNSSSSSGFKGGAPTGPVTVTVNSSAPITARMTAAALKLAFDKAAGGRKL